MHWTTWAIPLAIGAGWQFYRMWRATVVPIVQLDKDDPALVEAIARARATMPDFIRALEAPPPSHRDFSIKALFPELQEHMWVSDPRYVAGEFTGTLGNIPAGSTTLKLGDEVCVPEAWVTDWKYIDNDVLAGGYTLRVIRDRMSEKARKDFDSRIDFKILND
jgi:uncharacterized protein YegJ (DUF2314 family)